MTPARANEQAARELRWLRDQARILRGAVRTISTGTNYGRGVIFAYEEMATTMERRAARLRKSATARARGK